MKKQTVRTSKVLPFATKQGDVPGHEVATHSDTDGDPVHYVVFRVFDYEADMPTEVIVHWTEASKYMKRKWPSGGEVTAVLLESGRRVFAKAWSVSHRDAGEYLAAPILARDRFKITTLNGARVLWEVVGVDAWSYSKRDAEATARLLRCPWERDNEAFRARMAELTPQD